MLVSELKMKIVLAMVLAAAQPSPKDVEISFALFLLIQHPEVQHKLFYKIHPVFFFGGCHVS